MCVCLVSLYFPSLELGQVFTPSQLSHSDVDAVLNSWLTLLSKLFSLSPGLPFPDLQLGKSGANSPISLRNPISVYICCVNTILSSWNDLGFYWRCFQKKKKMIKKYSCEVTMGYSGDCFKTSDKIENLATSHSCERALSFVRVGDRHMLSESDIRGFLGLLCGAPYNTHP